MAQDESALLIPALEMLPLVGEFRFRYDPGARSGVPPHITIMYPFLDPNQLTSQTFTDLDALFGATEAFAYALTEVREFGQDVLYLAPEPAQPFIDLTTLVSRRFAVLPFGGLYPTVIPHLTVARSASRDERKRIGAALTPVLPQVGRASEAWLIVGSNETSWKTVHVMTFRTESHAATGERR